MTLQINGQTRATEAREIAALVAELGLPAQAVLVEHNGVALRRDEWAGRTLGEGDRLEIIRIVAGG
jgi:sulfur carrier protein